MVRKHFILNICLSDKFVFADDLVIVANCEDNLQIALHSLSYLSEIRSANVHRKDSVIVLMELKVKSSIKIFGRLGLKILMVVKYRCPKLRLPWL